MCQDINKKVSTIVNDWVTKGYMFSAFDVTKKMRHMGESVAHWEVRNAVRDMFGTGSMNVYMRTLVSISNTETFIYHSLTSDPYIYDANWLTSNPSQDNMHPSNTSTTQTTQTTQTNTGTNPPSVSAVKVKDGKVHLTKENRLNISSDLIENLGVGYGDTIVVENSSSNGIANIVIGKYQYPPRQPQSRIAMYTVDSENRVRLSSKTLISAFGPPMATAYSVSYDKSSDSIIVEPA